MKKDFIKKNRKMILALFSLIIFLIMLILVLKVNHLKIDKYMINLMINKVRNDNLTIFMKMVTFLGSAYGLIIITILMIIFLRNKKTSLLTIINLIAATILNQCLKLTFQRPRPIDNFLIEEKGYSFPSGHSMVSMAFYGFFIYLTIKSNLKKWIKAIIVSILTIIIILIGLSRIYLGVHYASDVIAGLALAITYLMIFISLAIDKKEVKEDQNEK